MLLYKILGFLFLGAAIVLILSQFAGEGDEYDEKYWKSCVARNN